MMKRSILIFVLLSCGNFAFGQEEINCPTNTSGMVHDLNVPIGYGAPGLLCEGCRELNQFPGDFRNFAINFILHGEGSVARNLMEGTLSGGEDRSSNFVVCNQMGQCTQATIVTHMDGVGIGIAPVDMSINFRVDSYTVRITLSNGNQTQATYNSGFVDQNSLPVPVDGQDDGVADGQCLSNNGDPTEPGDPDGDVVATDDGSDDGTSDSDGGSGGSVGGGGGEGEGFGGGPGGGPGILPPGGLGGGFGDITQPELECWIFITREKGKIIAAEIRCYRR